jgi:RNA polymerase sigma factor (TIGR02999 family)
MCGMEHSPEEITVLLNELAQGHKNVESQLVRSLYQELHKLAAFRLRNEQKASSLRPTELVNEAYLKLLAKPHQNWQNRTHFFATAAIAMRNILIDYIHAKQAGKRGGEMVRVELGEEAMVTPDRYDELLAIHEVLDKLKALDPEQGRIVEMRYFAGFTMIEIADILQTPLRTVEREWGCARNWLYGELRRTGRER